MPIVQSAMLLGLVKGMGLKGVLIKLGLTIKAGTAKTVIGKAGADFGLLLGLSGGAVISTVLFEKAAEEVNEHLKAHNYGFTISPEILQAAKTALAGIDAHTAAEYLHECTDGGVEQWLALVLNREGGYHPLVANAASAGLVQIAKWKYEEKAGAFRDFSG